MLKEFFISLLHYFVDITTAVIIAAAVYLTFSHQQMENVILWQILLIHTMSMTRLTCWRITRSSLYAACILPFANL